MKTPWTCDYKYVFGGYLTTEGINVIMARIDQKFRDVLVGTQLQQGDTLNLYYGLHIPDDPLLPRMPLWKRIRCWYRRRVNSLKRHLCRCS